MPKLYELTDKYNGLMMLMDKMTEQNGEDGEDGDSPVLQNMLKEITGEIEDKVENIGKLIRCLEAEETAIASEIKRLNERRGAIVNHATRLKDYLLSEMMAMEVDRVKRPLFTVSVRTNPPSCQILDADALPQGFRRVIPETWQPDRKAILENFKATGEIPEGVEIIRDRKSLQIR